MNESKRETSGTFIRSCNSRQKSTQLGVCNRVFLAIAMATCLISFAARAQLFGGLGLGLGLGGSTGIGVGVQVAGTIMIQPQSPPILLAGLGSSFVYQLMIAGPASSSLQVQSANALVLFGAYQWAAVTNIVLGDAGYAIVDVSIPLGQSYLYQVVVVSGSGSGSGSGSTPSPDPARWAKIDAGTFTMGSPETEYDRSDDESPQTQVTISHGFWIGRFEVTQGEYSAVVGSDPATFNSDSSQPVEQVIWYDASNYCAMLTAQEQSAGRLPAGYVYRLPTEAEWEYTARAGTSTRFFFGDDDHTYSQLPGYAWFVADSGGSTHDGGGKQDNQWGLYDTSGNVFEWCSDWYGPYPGGSVTDPTGAPSGMGRVMRGGSWRFPGGDCRSAARNFNTPDFASFGIGFRVVLSQTH